MEAPPPLDDGPEKKKTKQVEKPLPPILEDMDSLSLNDYEFTTESRPIKDSKGVEETREVTLSVTKANTTINLDKDLNVHQLRKLVRKLGVTKGNLNKTECRYYMWKTKQELGTINHNLQQIPSTQCGVINVLFHRDFIVDFMAYNDTRSCEVQEKGNGCQFQRFWKRVVEAVNGSDHSPQKEKANREGDKETMYLYDSDDSTQLEVEDSLSLDDTKKQLDEHFEETLDPYGQLQIREDTESNKPYNQHVMEAKTTGIDPSLENTLQTTEKEVQVLFKSLLSVRKQIDALINTSGNHSSDPWDFSKTAVYRAKASKLSMFVAFYFYSKSELVPDFGKTFTSTLPEILAHDSSVPQAVGRGRASRCSTPTSMVTAPTNDSHSEIATAIASMKDSMVEDSKKREERLDRASLLHEFQTIQQMIKDEDDVDIKATMKKRFKELSDSLFK